MNLKILGNHYIMELLHSLFCANGKTLNYIYRILDSFYLDISRLSAYKGEIIFFPEVNGE